MSYINFSTLFVLVFSILVVLRTVLSFLKVIVERTGKFTLSAKEQVILAAAISYIVSYHALP